MESRGVKQTYNKKLVLAMKQYKMPFILGTIALLLAALSLIIGVIELIEKGITANTYFAAIIFIGGLLSGINLLRLHRQLKNRKPPESKSMDKDAAPEAGDQAEKK